MNPNSCFRCGGPLAAGVCMRCIAAAQIGSSTPTDEPPARPTLDAAAVAPDFPTYEIGEVLGRGATGIVFRARHKALGRACALKIIAEDVANRPGFAERFEREARTLGGLQHPGIVAVHDAGRAGRWFFLAMELVDGADLRQMLTAKRVSPREALAIVAQMCDALQYAHDSGVVHRDIKPENVLVDRTGRVRILDFGLARVVRESTLSPHLTRIDQVMGTPLYMAPEQWRTPLEVDHRADIYSLGVVFYELLTGELPVGRFPPPSQRVELDVRLDEVVLKTLEREPDRRYQNVSEVKTGIGAAQGPIVMPPPIPAGVPAASTKPRDGATRAAPSYGLLGRHDDREKFLLVTIVLIVSINVVLLFLFLAMLL